MLWGCRLKMLSAWQFALLGCWEGVRLPEEFPCLVKPCFPLLQGHIAREPGLCVTNPAPEPISAWDWQGSSWLLEQHLYPSGEESSALLSSFYPGFDKNNLRKFTFSFVQTLDFLLLSYLEALRFCTGM